MRYLSVAKKLKVRNDEAFDGDGNFAHLVPVVLENVTIYSDHNGEVKYYFDAEEAQRWVDFIEESGRHVKAEWRGERFKLEAWQKWVIFEFFGWRRLGTKLRRYKYWFDYVPRKNGKSLLIALVAIGFLLIDGEKSPEIYNVASAKDQSDTLFYMAQLNCGWEDFEPADPEIVELTQVSKNLIKCPGNGGEFRPLPFSPAAFHGKNPSLVIVEEYHAHPTDEMRDVGTTGQGVRSQPAVILDTTAGEDTDTPCYEELLLARDIRDGVIVMPNYLPVIFEAAEDDPWDSIDVAAACNPQFGLSLTRQFFEDSIAMAKVKPLQKRTYIQLQLNRFVQDKKAAIDFDDWVACRDKFDFRHFRGHKIYGGLDVGSVDDLSAFVMVCPTGGLFGDWYVHAHFWCPERGIIQKKSRANYELWKEQGFLVETPGNGMDLDAVEKQIQMYSQYFNFGRIYGDRAYAMGVMSHINLLENVEIETTGQGTFSMTEPIKFLLTLVLSGRLKHNNPILDWMCKNVILRGNDRACMFEKKSASGKIDGMVALAMAIAAALRDLGAGEDGSGVRII